MATNIYIKFEGPEAKGESTVKNHKDQIEVLSWSHGFSQPTSPTRSTAGSGTVEKANHSDFSFTKYLDSSTDDILKICWAGDQVDKVTLEAYRADKADVAYLTIEMEKVIVSSVSVSGGGGDLPIENVSLAYAKVTYTYVPQKKEDGTGGAKEPVSQDLATNEEA